MRFVFASYVVTESFNDPEAWLFCIRIYTGILEALALKNEVISIEQINYEGDHEKNGVKYKFIRSKKHPHSSALQVNRLIKNLDPDVVVIQSLLFPLQIIALRMILGRRVKIIIHNHAERPSASLRKYASLMADKLTDAYLFASKDLGMDWIRKCNLSSPKKIHEVMEVSSVFHTINKDAAREQTGAKGSPIFLWVGRLNDNKDPLNVIKAFLRFAAEYPSAKLYMIYHTYELLPEINDLLSSHPQKDAIILVGKVPHQDLLYWFNSAEFFLSGSYYEGSGTAVCEAMSCGCVPVVTDIPSFRMITDHGRCGWLYQPGNEDELLSVLRETQQTVIETKRKLSLDYFRSTLSFEAIALRIHAIASSL